MIHFYIIYKNKPKIKIEKDCREDVAYKTKKKEKNAQYCYLISSTFLFVFFFFFCFSCRSKEKFYYNFSRKFHFSFGLCVFFFLSLSVLHTSKSLNCVPIFLYLSFLFYTCLLYSNGEYV